MIACFIILLVIAILAATVDAVMVLFPFILIAIGLRMLFRG